MGLLLSAAQTIIGPKTFKQPATFDGRATLKGGVGPFYDTNWISRSDWTDVHLGSDKTKDTDSDITHGLHAPLWRLLVRVLISTDGTDDASFEVFNYARELAIAPVANQRFGLTVFQVSVDALRIQTGAEGLLYTVDSGGTHTAIDTEDWYYRVIVWRYL